MSRLADGLLLVAAVLLAFWLGTLQGRADGALTEHEAAEQRERHASDLQAQALAVANERHRATEARLRTDLADQAATFTKTFNDEKAKHARLVADLRAGTVRVSVPVLAAPAAACAAHAGGDPAAAAGDRHEARAELAPAAAADLAAIAGDGDAGIQQLNACIDAFNTVRARLNAARTDAQAQ